MPKPAPDTSTPFFIGLTGGIATGKSTVSRYLAQTYRFPVLDADQYAREALEPGAPAFEKTLARYGAAIQTPEGSLDRKQLGEIIFRDPEEKRWLESQIHPWVKRRFQEAMGQCSAPAGVLDIPLLFEAGLTALAGEIWVVACSEDLQIRRLQKRNGLTASQARARIASQWPLATKIAQADVVLDNSLDLPHLYRQIDQALERRGLRWP